MRGIVWTAVISALAALGSLIAAWQSSIEFVLALGFASVASALLSTRER